MTLTSSIRTITVYSELSKYTGIYTIEVIGSISDSLFSSSYTLFTLYVTNSDSFKGSPPFFLTDLVDQSLFLSYSSIYSLPSIIDP